MEGHAESPRVHETEKCNAVCIGPHLLGIPWPAAWPAIPAWSPHSRSLLTPLGDPQNHSTTIQPHHWTTVEPPLHHR
eukprot:2722284-Rhodomonas_salina.2